MRNLSTENYTYDQIIKMLKGNRKEKYRFELLDKNMVYLTDVTSTNAQLNFDATADITRVLKATINDVEGINWIDVRIRPYYSLYTPSGWVDFPLGLFIVSSPVVYADGTYKTREIECYDLAVILKEDKVTSRYFIPQGSNYTNEVLKLLNSAGITNVIMENTDLTISTPLEYELGTPKLDIINNLLAMINYYRLYFDADGFAIIKPYVLPALKTPDETYDTDLESVVKEECSDNQDIFDTPNSFVVYLENPEEEELISTYVNNDPGNKLSTISRGRTITYVESVNNIADKNTLDAYVYRVAAELAAYEEFTFKTSNMPHHGFLECLVINNKNMGIEGKYIEQSWTMRLVTGGEMDHVVRRVIPV